MNNHTYPHLTNPIQLGKVTFRNRIFSAPIGATDITADCCPGPRTQGFYELMFSTAHTEYVGQRITADGVHAALDI